MIPPLSMADQRYVTRPTLLLRLRDREDQHSWTEFVEIYGPLIHRFALSRGVPHHDAADITQDVLRNVSRAMQRFEYDPKKGSFRSWLFTAVRREIGGAAEKQRRKPGTAGPDDADAYLRQLPDEQDTFDWHGDYQRRLVSWAMAKIKAEFAENTWGAFLALGLEGKSAQEASEALGITVGSAYVAKCRVLKRLTEMIRSVDDEEWEVDLIRSEGRG